MHFSSPTYELFGSAYPRLLRTIEDFLAATQVVMGFKFVQLKSIAVIYVAGMVLLTLAIAFSYIEALRA